jgi:hypothetical protein
MSWKEMTMNWMWLVLAFYAGFMLAVFVIGLNRAATTGSDHNQARRDYSPLN